MGGGGHRGCEWLSVGGGGVGRAEEWWLSTGSEGGRWPMESVGRVGSGSVKCCVLPGGRSDRCVGPHMQFAMAIVGSRPYARRSMILSVLSVAAAAVATADAAVVRSAVGAAPFVGVAGDDTVPGALVGGGGAGPRIVYADASVPAPPSVCFAEVAASGVDAVAAAASPEYDVVVVGAGAIPAVASGVAAIVATLGPTRDTVATPRPCLVYSAASVPVLPFVHFAEVAV
ncbi:hypothetical protein CBR_g22436 [Chara braunii]|uniref:Uncharacterized protein n=1 Tax=Chara braunii TaxID=69332 RepID=A0A388JV12_CHABU|nr:hypothetical protein CBR_g22436 [Chara braunii]|eukprot:GBG61638.1 hypothetical protein CBR_g22436 [Chara braunii]